MKDAAFTLLTYKFTNVILNLSSIGSEDEDLNISITPSGVFVRQDRKFILKFTFEAKNKKGDLCISVVCDAVYLFRENLDYEEIPSYFFPNSIAILFPYVRAFISTLTLQANYQPLVLPTMNLSDLSNILKEHVVIE